MQKFRIKLPKYLISFHYCIYQKYIENKTLNLRFWDQQPYNKNFTKLLLKIIQIRFHRDFLFFNNTADITESIYKMLTQLKVPESFNQPFLNKVNIKYFRTHISFLCLNFPFFLFACSISPFFSLLCLICLAHVIFYYHFVLAQSLMKTK